MAFMKTDGAEESILDLRKGSNIGSNGSLSSGELQEHAEVPQTPKGKEVDVLNYLEKLRGNIDTPAIKDWVSAHFMSESPPKTEQKAVENLQRLLHNSLASSLSGFSSQTQAQAGLSSILSTFVYPPNTTTPTSSQTNNNGANTTPANFQNPVSVSNPFFPSWPVQDVDSIETEITPLLSSILNNRKRRRISHDTENQVSFKKSPTPGSDEPRDSSYWERRRKNNDAAKRSRDLRRRKEEEIAIRAAYLEQENLKLKAQVALLKTETAKLQYMLYNRA